MEDEWRLALFLMIGSSKKPKKRPIKWPVNQWSCEPKWAALGREIWRQKKNQTSKKFKPLGLGEERIDLTSSKGMDGGARRWTALDTNILVGIMVSSSSLPRRSSARGWQISRTMCTTPTKWRMFSPINSSKVFRFTDEILKGRHDAFWIFGELQCTHLGRNTSWWNRRWSQKIDPWP